MLRHCKEIIIIITINNHNNNAYTESNTCIEATVTAIVMWHKISDKREYKVYVYIYAITKYSCIPPKSLQA